MNFEFQILRKIELVETLPQRACSVLLFPFPLGSWFLQGRTSLRVPNTQCMYGHCSASNQPQKWLSWPRKVYLHPSLLPDALCKTEHIHLCMVSPNLLANEKPRTWLGRQLSGKCWPWARRIFQCYPIFPFLGWSRKPSSPSRTFVWKRRMVAYACIPSTERQTQILPAHWPDSLADLVRLTRDFVSKNSNEWHLRNGK